MSTTTTTTTTTKTPNVKQLERQAGQLAAKRDKERSALADTEGKLGDTLKALAEARKAEGTADSNGNGTSHGKKKPAKTAATDAGE